MPLVALSEVEAVTLVTDRPGPSLPKLDIVIPPALLTRLLGRALAKLIICVVTARRRRLNWVVGLNLVPHALNALITGRLVGARVMYYELGGPVEWRGGGWQGDSRVLTKLPRGSRTLERLLLRTIRRFDAVAVMGERGREALIEQGVASSRLTLIPASIDGNRFYSRDKAAKPYHLVTVSALIRRKRVEDFISAVERLGAQIPDLRAAIVGTGPLEPELRALARSLGVADRVDFLGFRADIEEVLAQSEVFVLTSNEEGLSVALTEAMATELPAVVSDVGEARALVRDDETGFLFPPGDLARLTDAVIRLLDDEGLRHRLGAEARRVALAVAGRERIAALYRKALTGESEADG